MRWTPHTMVLLGILLFFWAYSNIHAGIMAEGLALSIRNAARNVSARMSEDDMRRVFDMPEGVADRGAWFESYCGLFWATPVRTSANVNAFVPAGLGILLCVWGVVERCRRPAPA